MRCMQIRRHSMHKLHGCRVCVMAHGRYDAIVFARPMRCMCLPAVMLLHQHYLGTSRFIRPSLPSTVWKCVAEILPASVFLSLRHRLQHSRRKLSLLSHCVQQIRSSPTTAFVTPLPPSCLCTKPRPRSASWATTQSTCATQSLLMIYCVRCCRPPMLALQFLATHGGRAWVLSLNPMRTP